MTDRHIIYIGRFLHDGNYAEFRLNNSGVAIPVIRAPIDTCELDPFPNLLPFLRDGGYVCLDLIELSETVADSLRMIVTKYSYDCLDGSLRVTSISHQIGSGG